MSQLRTFRQYGALPRLLGWSFLVVGFLGRLPTSMVVLGVLTLVASATGSVGDAGLASASLALSTAVSGPIIGRWTDRRGQRVPLLILAPVNAAALAALVVAAGGGAPLSVLCVLCVAVGATTVPVGSLARVRWLALGGGPRQSGAALGYESMADEMVFVLGPALVGVAASLGTPELPVLIAAVLVLLFVTAFALHRSAAGTAREPEPVRALSPAATRASGVAAPVRSVVTAHKAPSLVAVLKAVAPALAGMACVGMFFGASQTAVTAFATAAGTPGRAGLIYAVMGVGSAVMALAVVALPDVVSLRLRLMVCGAGIAGISAAMTAATSTAALTALVLAVGLLVGPALVTLFTAAGRIAPPGGTAVAMTAMGSANVVGVAAAAALAGHLADLYGAQAGFAVAAGSAAALAVAAVAVRVPQRRLAPGDV
ncbi:MFS transporter [Georgenia yuyongxinii]|uniref:MFS transporter n=1 Tax=Georgenia yuyongxinii TaxID=2589797 RepID=A0A5B8C674_9MICO|nr:MFS transporter [Georgenia yuyongxinii]QDC24835.1 MFS transporter [Georgenia yuyongxinii]